MAALLTCGFLSLANPGILIGAGVALLFGRFITLHWAAKWATATLLAVVAFALRFAVVPLWPWRLWSMSTPLLDKAGLNSVPLSSRLIASVFVEGLLGPLVLLVSLGALALMRHGLPAQLRAEHRRARMRLDAVAGRRWRSRKSLGRSFGPPAENTIRLGIDRETHRPFDLQLAELELHTALLGASGSGKTTTLARLADGVLGLGYGIIVIDAKGGDLKETTKMLAERARVPYRLVDASDPASVGYDPCSGDAADVSNKLIGVFSYSPAGEIFKNVAMATIPVIVRAMEQAGVPITLRSLATALIPGRMREIGRQAGEPFQRDLDILAEAKGVVEDGILGLRVRLDALLQGKFGPLFDTAGTDRVVLDWSEAMSAPSVTYVLLAATAASEDVDLVARVIAQDLKQQCAKRIRAVAEGERLVPVLCILDEFAAWNEPTQAVDLLLQARQALMPTIISTQYIPEKLNIRQAVLQAGLIIAHRLEAGDAEVVAAQMGTKDHFEWTAQIDHASGPTGLGSVTASQAYLCHPNSLRSLGRGYVAVRSVLRDEPAIVQVDPVLPVT
jgi:hypothetical protein